MALRTVRLGGAYFFSDGGRVTVLGARFSDEPVKEGVLTRRGIDVVLGARDGAFALGDVRPNGRVDDERVGVVAWSLPRRRRSSMDVASNTQT